MFTCCVNRIVFSMVNNLHNASANSPAILFATPSDEPHECGILLSCLLAASQQYRCYFLGANLPGKDIVEAAQHLQPDIIVIGLVKTPPEPTTPALKSFSSVIIKCPTGQLPCGPHFAEKNLIGSS